MSPRRRGPIALGIPLADASRFDLTATSRVWTSSLWRDVLVIHAADGGSRWDLTRCGVPTWGESASLGSYPVGVFGPLGAFNVRRARLCRRCYRGALDRSTS